MSDEATGGKAKTIAFWCVILGVLGIFVVPKLINPPPDPIRDNQKDPVSAAKLYQKVAYGLIHQQADSGFMTLEKTVTKADWEWFNTNWENLGGAGDPLGGDPFGLKTGADPTQVHALGKHLALVSVLEAGSCSPNDEVINTDIRENEAFITVRHTDIQSQGTTDFRMHVVKEGKYWVVEGFGCGRRVIENTTSDGEVVHSGMGDAIGSLDADEDGDQAPEKSVAAAEGAGAETSLAGTSEQRAANAIESSVEKSPWDVADAETVNETSPVTETKSGEASPWDSEPSASTPEASPSSAASGESTTAEANPWASDETKSSGNETSAEASPAEKSEEVNAADNPWVEAENAVSDTAATEAATEAPATPEQSEKKPLLGKGGRPKMTTESLKQALAGVTQTSATGTSPTAQKAAVNVAKANTAASRPPAGGGAAKPAGAPAAGTKVAAAKPAGAGAKPAGAGAKPAAGPGAAKPAAGAKPAGPGANAVPGAILGSAGDSTLKKFDPVAVQSADMLIEEARKNWDQGKFKLSVINAEKALTIYQRYLKETHPKIVKVKGMIKAAKEKSEAS